MYVALKINFSFATNHSCYTCEGQDSCKMVEENLFYTKLTESYILTCADYEDSNRLFPIQKDTRNLMRTCERCSVSFDINSPSGRCCYHQSFFKLTVE